MHDRFERLLGLVKRTGEKLVVTDPKGEEAYVLMPLAEYEALLDASALSFYGGDEEELPQEPDEDFTLDDTMLFPPDPSESMGATKEIHVHPPEPPRVWDHIVPAGSSEPTWDPSRLNDQEKREVKEVWDKQIPPAAEREIEEKNEEITLEPLPSMARDPAVPKVEEEAGEDRFFLEPIE